MTFSLNFGSLLAVRVGDYCVGDGVANDYAGLTQAISVAGTTQALVFQPGKTYLVGTCVVFPSTLKIIGNGAKIIKSTSLNDYAVLVTGANVQMVDLNLDGNRAGGNANLVGCLRWDGTGGVAEHVKATNAKGAGIYVQGSGVLDAYACESSDHVAATGGGDGFQAANGGLLRTYNCRGDNNGRCGFRFQATAANGCRLDGTANNNLFMGAEILSARGSGGRFVSSNNESYGVYGKDASGWSFDYLEDNDCGQGLNGEYSFNTTATSLELFGCDRFHVANAVSRRAGGYGVALTAGTSVGCTYCYFGHVFVDSAGDPAFHISGSSQFNTVDCLDALNPTVAVSFGEGFAGVANNYNAFGLIHAIACGYSVIRGDRGAYNTFGRVKATDCWNRSPYTSLVDWSTADSHHNKINAWESLQPGSPPVGTTLPAYVMKCDAAAAHNWIADGVILNLGAGTVAALSDANGTNRVDVLTPP